MRRRDDVRGRGRARECRRWVVIECFGFRRVTFLWGLVGRARAESKVAGSGARARLAVGVMAIGTEPACLALPGCSGKYLPVCLSRGALCSVVGGLVNEFTGLINWAMHSVSNQSSFSQGNCLSVPLKFRIVLSLESGTTAMRRRRENSIPCG